MRQTDKTHIELHVEQLREVRDFAGEQGHDVLVTDLHYSKGGINYFSGNTHKRGYTLSVQLRTRCATSESFTIGGGIVRAEFIEETKSFSAKKLQALSVDPVVLAKAEALRAQCRALYAARHAQEAIAV